MIRGRSLLTVLAVRGRRQIPVDADVTPGPDVREVLAGRQSMIHPRPTGPGRDIDRCQRLEVGADGPTTSPAYRRSIGGGGISSCHEIPPPGPADAHGADEGDRSNTASTATSWTGTGRGVRWGCLRLSWGNRPLRTRLRHDGVSSSWDQHPAGDVAAWATGSLNPTFCGPRPRCSVRTRAPRTDATVGVCS